MCRTEFKRYEALERIPTMSRSLRMTALLSQDDRAIGRVAGPRAWDSEESVALVRHVLEGMK